MTTEPLNPAVQPLFQPRYAENTSGIIAVITACIDALGGTVTSYPSNTAGIIQALIDLQTILSGNSGVVVTLPVVAGESISVGQAVYLAGDGLAYKGTNASSRAAAAVLGFAKTTVSPGSNLIVIGRGRLAAFSGLYPGQEYYLALDGGITATPPNGGGVYLVNVGQALSSTELDVDMQPPVLLV